MNQHDETSQAKATCRTTHERAPSRSAVFALAMGIACGLIFVAGVLVATGEYEIAVSMLFVGSAAFLALDRSGARPRATNVRRC